MATPAKAKTQPKKPASSAQRNRPGATAQKKQQPAGGGAQATSVQNMNPASQRLTLAQLRQIYPNAGEWMTIENFATRICLYETTVRDAVRLGSIPAHQVIQATGRATLIHSDALQTFRGFAGPVGVTEGAPEEAPRTRTAAG